MKFQSGGGRGREIRAFFNEISEWGEGGGRKLQHTSMKFKSGGGGGGGDHSILK